MRSCPLAKTEQQFVCNSARSRARGGGERASRLVHAEVDRASLPLL